MPNVLMLMQAYSQLINQAAPVAPVSSSPKLQARSSNDFTKSLSYLQNLKNMLNTTSQSTAANSAFVNGDSGKHITGGMASSSTSGMGMQTIGDSQRQMLLADLMSKS